MAVVLKDYRTVDNLADPLFEEIPLEERIRSVVTVPSLNSLKIYANSMPWLGQPASVLVDASGLFASKDNKQLQRILQRKNIKLYTTQGVYTEMTGKKAHERSEFEQGIIKRLKQTILDQKLYDKEKEVLECLAPCLSKTAVYDFVMEHFNIIYNQIDAGRKAAVISDITSAQWSNLNQNLRKAIGKLVINPDEKEIDKAVKKYIGKDARDPAFMEKFGNAYQSNARQILRRIQNCARAGMTKGVTKDIIERAYGNPINNDIRLVLASYVPNFSQPTNRDQEMVEGAGAHSYNTLVVTRDSDVKQLICLRQLLSNLQMQLSFRKGYYADMQITPLKSTEQTDASTTYKSAI